jgi:hypothetical protein
MHTYILRVFQFAVVEKAGDAWSSADMHTHVATYEDLTEPPMVPQIGTTYRLRDPKQTEVSGRVLEVCVVAYGTRTTIEIYLSSGVRERRPCPPTRTPNELELLKLAAYFQKDYAQKLPVVGAFRRWRNGLLPDAEFLGRLREDDVGPALGYEDVPPMRGLALLNDYIDEKK